MIWFDLVTPKSVMFFKNIIELIKEKGVEVLVTAREGQDYTEVVELLDLYHIPFVNRGTFGGAGLKDKLKASIDRQLSLMEFVSDYDIQCLVCLCSVDANRVAFGLGIPIINFYDIPLSDYKTDFKKALPQARLTLPLSTKAFHPYMVPREIFERFGLEDDQIITYHFLDVVAWLDDFKADRSYYNAILEEHGLDENKPTVIVREEEFKSSYVKHQYPIFYDGINQLNKEVDANFIIIPRYEPGKLKEKFPFAAILDQKIVVQHLLAYADLFIGGGGTLNSEACYFGTPTISTRSFVSHYDKLLISKGLMEKADTSEELVKIGKLIIGERRDAKVIFDKMSLDLEEIVNKILH